MWEGGCLLLWEGVIWLARLGMHLRGERACAKPLPSLNALAADAGVVAADAGVVAVTRLHVRGKGMKGCEVLVLSV